MSVIILDSKNRPDIEAALSEQLGSILAVDLISKAGESERVAELRADWITSPRLEGEKIRALLPQARRVAHLKHGQDRQFCLRSQASLNHNGTVLDALTIGEFKLEVMADIIVTRPIAPPPSLVKFVPMEERFWYIFYQLLRDANSLIGKEPGQFAF